MYDWDDSISSRTYVILPPTYSNLGKISFPVEGSRGGKISNVARILAIVSQIPASARNRPR